MQYSEIDKRIRTIIGSPGPDNDGTNFILKTHCGFEEFGAYEDWGWGYEIILPKIYLKWAHEDKPLSVKGKTIDEVLTRVETVLENYNQHPDWSGAAIMGYLIPPK